MPRPQQRRRKKQDQHQPMDVVEKIHAEPMDVDVRPEPMEVDQSTHDDETMEVESS